MFKKTFVLTRPPLRARFANSARIEESARRAKTLIPPPKAAASEEARRYIPHFV
jgi:hypothetical protein